MPQGLDAAVSALRRVCSCCSDVWPARHESKRFRPKTDADATVWPVDLLGQWAMCDGPKFHKHCKTALRFLYKIVVDHNLQSWPPVPSRAAH